jgi:hypothetical protein
LYKDGPFDKKTWGQVQDYQSLLASRVTELEVSCTQDDARITLDTEVILPKCPASATRKLAVQQDHVIVGEKPGYETRKIGPIRLAPGKKTVLEVKLVPSGKGHLARRWNKTVPWVVVTAGGVLTLSGFVPLYFGAKHIDSYDSAVTSQCPNGCPASDYPRLSALESDGKRDYHIAYGLFAAGGAVAVAGIAMVVLNQPHLEKAPAVAPSIGPDHAGVVVFGRW